MICNWLERVADDVDQALGEAGEVEVVAGGARPYNSESSVDFCSNSARARWKTASNMGAVRRPVWVFWRLGW